MNTRVRPRIRIRLGCLSIILPLLATALALCLTACGGSPAPSAAGRSASPAAVTRLTGPPTLAQVAGDLHATGVVNCGPAPLGGVTDSGSALLGSEHIGIDIFPSSTVRDAWKQTSANFGVAPFAEGTDWVAYKSVTQSGGCS